MKMDILSDVIQNALLAYNRTKPFALLVLIHMQILEEVV
jgi:hypothetical protein